MEVNWYSLGATALPPGVVLIEATERATPFWAANGPVMCLIEHLCNNLPTSDHPQVAFLGSRQTHTPNAVLDALRDDAGPTSAIVLQQQLGRFAVAGPFLREWERAARRPVVLVTVDGAHDLEDWCTPAVVNALLVYRLGGMDRVTPPAFREISSETSLDVVINHLRDPLVEVRIGGRAFPLDWACNAFAYEEGGLRSTGAALPTGPILLTHPAGAAPLAELRRASGAVVTSRLIPGDPPPPREPVPLPSKAGSVLRVWGAGRAFFCSTCTSAHPPGRFWCSGEPARGIIPDLPPHPGVVWLLHQQAGWTGTLYPRGIFRLPDGRVAVGRVGRWELYESQANGWCRVDAPEGLIVIDENTLLLST